MFSGTMQRLNTYWTALPNRSRFRFAQALVVGRHELAMAEVAAKTGAGTADVACRLRGAFLPQIVRWKIDNATQIRPIAAETRRATRVARRFRLGSASRIRLSVQRVSKRCAVGLSSLRRARAIAQRPPGRGPGFRLSFQSNCALSGKPAGLFILSPFGQGFPWLVL
jgi:hypothetical protein